MTDQEKYDAVLKELFSRPRIVAAILQMAVPEYQGMTVDEILPYILEISDDIPVDDTSAAALRNLPQEQTVLLGKIITYYKHIKARNPKTGELNITLFFDFEFQNKYRRLSLGYPLLKRGWFYAARELDGQLGILTENTDYGSLQKSYSIWICNEDIPETERNSMTRYRIVKEDVIGHSEDIPEDYDLMEVIVIRRGDDSATDEIFDFLNGIFNSQIDRVSRYSGSDPEIEEEVKKMGGFGAALVEKTETRARIEAQNAMIESMLRRGKTPEQIADFCGISLQQVKQVEQSMMVTV